MQYSIYTRGFNADYCWKNSQPRVGIQDYLNANGVLVARDSEGKFDVYLCSSPTEKKDYMGRQISIAVFVSGCTETKAKELAIWALEHWDNFADTFSTFVDDFGKDEWTVNNSVFKQWVDNVAEVAATDIPFENRLGNGNTDKSRKELIAELRQFKFNQKAGFKLVVDGGLMTGQRFKDIQYDADRYLFKDGERKVLPDRPVSTQTLTEKTTTSKSTGSSSPFLAVLLGMVIGIVACSGLFFYMYYELLTEYPSLSALKQTKEQLQEENNNLTNTIKQQTKDHEELNTQLTTVKSTLAATHEKVEIAKQEEEKAQQRARDLADGDPTKLIRALQGIEDQLVSGEIKRVVREWLDKVEPPQEH